MYKILSVTIIFLIVLGEVMSKSDHEFSENQPKIRSKRLLYGNVDEIRSPWQVALTNTINELIGSGSIITELWVITSSHCGCKDDGTARQNVGWAIAGVNDINPFINNNAQNLNETSRKDHLYFIDKIECGNNNLVDENHELALLRVNRKFLIGRNIRQIPIIKTTRKSVIGLNLDIRGWGADDVEENKWDYLLKRAERRVATKYRCKQLLSTINVTISLKDWEVCTDEKRWGNGCLGDAGNPLTLNDYLLAVFVWSLPKHNEFNCDPNQVDIHIMLTNNIWEWMERTISPVKKAKDQFFVNGTLFTAYQFVAA